MLVGMAYWSHLRAMLTNPGAVPPNAMPPEDAPSASTSGPLPMCDKCRAYKPPHAHHCSICRRCVARMDHHCPWVATCVGVRNTKFFVLFCFYTCAVSTYAVVLTAGKFLDCAYRPPHRMQHTFDPALAGTGANPVVWVLPEHCSSGVGDVSRTLLVVFLVLEALVFGVFTLCMLCDQYPALVTGNTALDEWRMHKSRVPVRPRFGTRRENLALVFGEVRWRVWWLVPVAPTWKRPEKVLEFRTPCSDGDGDDDGDVERGVV